MRRAASSRKMPSCPSLQGDGPVWERVWPGWSSSSSSPSSCRGSASHHRQGCPRKTWT
uniref:Uncharacterized protein n=1 Tax=Anguilla anguilla TaxID=7936 RepID=A0A0E9UJ27_ANGAN